MIKANGFSHPAKAGNHGRFFTRLSVLTYSPTHYFSDTLIFRASKYFSPFFSYKIIIEDYHRN